ncbi:MAG: hypothetical protein EZS28_030030 [Streblomastix strix]|uniref:POLO box domain-containing protein n=1 Tax=Streblomastix strix TaxID=222440 RepID=A0A5J4UXI1_9EUKA|nr:MAG: hypothetical protein EZS28_030030 [Streblomastix strix]
MEGKDGQQEEDEEDDEDDDEEEESDYDEDDEDGLKTKRGKQKTKGSVNEFSELDEQLFIVNQFDGIEDELIKERKRNKDKKDESEQSDSIEYNEEEDEKELDDIDDEEDDDEDDEEDDMDPIQSSKDYISKSDENMNSNSNSNIVAPSQYPLVHLLRWTRTKLAMMFQLSNRTFQTNFQDHSKVIIELNEANNTNNNNSVNGSDQNEPYSNSNPVFCTLCTYICKDQSEITLRLGDFIIFGESMNFNN